MLLKKTKLVNLVRRLTYRRLAESLVKHVMMRMVNCLGSNRRSELLLLVLASFILRAAAAAIVESPGRIGESSFAMMTQAILDGSFPSVFKPILYPVFLLVPISVNGPVVVEGSGIGHGGAYIWVWQAAVFSVTPALSYLIAERVFRRSAIAAIAGLMTLTYPYYVMASNRLLDTGLSILLVQGLVLAVLRYRSRPTFWRALAAGALAGLAVQVRPNVWVVVAVALVFMIAWTCSWRRSSVTLLGLAVGALPFVAGYALATYTLADHMRITPANAGYNLYVGHNDLTRAYLSQYGHPTPESVLFDDNPVREVWDEAASTRDLYELDKFGLDTAIDWARAHPKEELVLAVLKFRRYWDWRLEQDYHLLVMAAYTLPYLGLLLLISVPVISGSAFKTSERVFLVAVLGAYMLPFLVFFPTVRMRMPSEFLLIQFAALGAYQLGALVYRTPIGRLERLRGTQNLRASNPCEISTDEDSC